MRKGILRPTTVGQVSTGSKYSIGQRINATHTTQKPNPFEVVYAYDDYSGGYGCPATSSKEAMHTHSTGIDKQTLILLLLAFGLGYLLCKEK